MHKNVTTQNRKKNLPHKHIYMVICLPMFPTVTKPAHMHLSSEARFRTLSFPVMTQHDSRDAMMYLSHNCDDRNMLNHTHHQYWPCKTITATYFVRCFP